MHLDKPLILDIAGKSFQWQQIILWILNFPIIHKN